MVRRPPLKAHADPDGGEGATPDVDPVVLAVAVVLPLEVEPIEADAGGDLRIEPARETDDGAYTHPLLGVEGAIGLVLRIGEQKGVVRPVEAYPDANGPGHLEGRAHVDGTDGHVGRGQRHWLDGTIAQRQEARGDDRRELVRRLVLVTHPGDRDAGQEFTVARI